MDLSNNDETQSILSMLKMLTIRYLHVNESCLHQSMVVKHCRHQK